VHDLTRWYLDFKPSIPVEQRLPQSPKALPQAELSAAEAEFVHRSRKKAKSFDNLPLQVQKWFAEKKGHEVN
jgi:hypothetical protein